jgi:hypothetical protein
MDVSRIQQNSQEVFQIIKEQQQKENDLANKLVKMALASGSDLGKSTIAGQVVDITT